MMSSDREGDGSPRMCMTDTRHDGGRYRCQINGQPWSASAREVVEVDSGLDMAISDYPTIQSTRMEAHLGHYPEEHIPSSLDTGGEVARNYPASTHTPMSAIAIERESYHRDNRGEVTTPAAVETTAAFHPVSRTRVTHILSSDQEEAGR
ncbi:hypothetical protein FA13DRAFT_1714711 [Coprinellus micaceus]|uniref:Uncharacterized protein n=1 Tax=Coprinellus micaceus TaxID=71717 RepID=A0A4Y7SRJ6_COPMI|nr:hypothetical protein FA13DRAFT_1714711 [Coprinellus micaceus]